MRASKTKLLVVDVWKKQLLVGMLRTQTISLVRVNVAKSREDAFWFDRRWRWSKILLRNFFEQFELPSSNCRYNFDSHHNQQSLSQIGVKFLNNEINSINHYFIYRFQQSQIFAIWMLVLWGIEQSLNTWPTNRQYLNFGWRCQLESALRCIFGTRLSKASDHPSQLFCIWSSVGDHARIQECQTSFLGARIKHKKKKFS